MHYLNRACKIQVSAASSGTLLLPSSQVCEHTARQFRGEAADDYTDDAGNDLLWGALTRLLQRIAPDYAD